MRLKIYNMLFWMAVNLVVYIILTALLQVFIGVDFYSNYGLIMVIILAILNPIEL